MFDHNLVELTCKTNRHREEGWFDFRLTLIVGHPRRTLGKVSSSSDAGGRFGVLFRDTTMGGNCLCESLWEGKEYDIKKKGYNSHLIWKRSQRRRSNSRTESISRGKCGPRELHFKERDKNILKISWVLDTLVVYWMNLKNISESLLVPGSLLLVPLQLVPRQFSCISGYLGFSTGASLILMTSRKCSGSSMPKARSSFL